MSKKSGAPEKLWFSDHISLKALDEYNKIHANKVAEAQRAKQVHERLDKLSTNERTAANSLLTMNVANENPNIGLLLGDVPKPIIMMQQKNII